MMNSVFQSILTNPILEFEVLNNSLASYATALMWFVLYVLILKFVQFLVLNRFRSLTQKTDNQIDDALVEIVSSLKPPFYVFLAFYLATRELETSEYISIIFKAILIGWLIYQAIQVAQILLSYVVKTYLVKGEKGETESAIQALNLVTKIGLWSLGLVFFLSNIGVDVTSLIAGLGIGGIAVAFALQGILSDLFSSFTLYFDKPFKIGDFIVVGDKAGVVEKIGIKTSRIRALQGEEIVIPNQFLTANHIQNFKQMQRRRVVFEFRLSYQTPPSVLTKVPDMIKKIVENNEKAEFDRAHLKSLGEFALIYEIVYHVTDREYSLFMDIQQAINLEILEQFAKHKIKIAYPTQAVEILKNT